MKPGFDMEFSLVGFNGDNPHIEGPFVILCFSGGKKSHCLARAKAGPQRRSDAQSGKRRVSRSCAGVSKSHRQKRKSSASFWDCRAFWEFGAQKRTRTSTPFRVPAPEAGASTNSAIWATEGDVRGSRAGVNRVFELFLKTPAISASSIWFSMFFRWNQFHWKDNELSSFQLRIEGANPAETVFK